MNRTVTEITAQIARLEVSALDSRFDAQQRAMFRKSIRMLKKELVS